MNVKGRENNTENHKHLQKDQTATNNDLVQNVIKRFMSINVNIFMDHFERKYVSPFLQGLSLIYLKFIDDMFFIWTGSKEKLIRNLDELNTKQDSIKFECKISKTSISFLDAEVYIKNKKLYSKIYRK